MVAQDVQLGLDIWEESFGVRFHFNLAQFQYQIKFQSPNAIDNRVKLGLGFLVGQPICYELFNFVDFKRKAWK